jgi:hypothetical protein
VFPEILNWRFILLNKGKNSRKILLTILAITAVSLWIFPLHLHAQENEKKDKSRKSFLEQTRKIFQTEKNKREIPGTRRVPQTEENKKETPGKVKEPPRTEETKKEIPGESKETPQTEKNKNETPGESKETPKTEKIKKKTPGESKKAPQTEKIKKKIPDEIINISKLDKTAKEFSINRDIFSPDLMKPVAPGSVRQEVIPSLPPPLPGEIKKEIPTVDPKAEIEKEIQGLSYEGYVVKNKKNCALISMNGEFFAVTVGDIILEKIKIIKIDKKTITVEVESYEFEIQIKEDEENETQ